MEHVTEVVRQVSLLMVLELSSHLARTSGCALSTTNSIIKYS